MYNIKFSEMKRCRSKILNLHTRLIRINQLSDDFIDDVKDIVRLGQRVWVKVLEASTHDIFNLCCCVILIVLVIQTYNILLLSSQLCSCEGAR